LFACCLFSGDEGGVSVQGGGGEAAVGVGGLELDVEQIVPHRLDLGMILGIKEFGQRHFKG